MFKEKIEKEEINALPTRKYEGEILLISSPEEIKVYCDEISEHAVIGFDTETKPSFKKGRSNTVALLQLATNQRAYIFQLKKTGLPVCLQKLLSDPEVLKVGVAIRDDICSLQKIAPYTPNGFVELQQMVKEYGIEDNGLKKLVANILGFKISKRQQTSNWEADPLSIAQIEYAATDAWVCLEIYQQLTAIKQ